MKVSVLVTTYNSSVYLKRVLEGYLRQSVMPFEIIVADDGSSDNTAAVVSCVAKCAPFPIKHIWHEDLGFRAAKIRNEGVKAATGDYIVFTDGDCIPHPSFVEDHIYHAACGYFVQGKRMLVGQELSRQYCGASWLENVWYCLTGRMSGAHHLIRARSTVRLVGTGMRGIRSCNMGLLKKDVLAINGFDESFVGWGREDSDFAFRLTLYGLKRKDPIFSALVFHLWHQENSRSSLEANDELFQSRIASATYLCKDGIVKE